MSLFRAICWTLFFILRLRFPPSCSITTTLDMKTDITFKLFSKLSLELSCDQLNIEPQTVQMSIIVLDYY